MVYDCTAHLCHSASVLMTTWTYGYLSQDAISDPCLSCCVDVSVQSPS